MFAAVDLATWHIMSMVFTRLIPLHWVIREWLVIMQWNKFHFSLVVSMLNLVIQTAVLLTQPRGPVAIKLPWV